MVADLNNTGKLNANFDPIVDARRFKANSILLKASEIESSLIGKQAGVVDGMFKKLNVEISPSKRKMIKDHYDLVYREPSPRGYLRSFFIGMRS